MTDDDTRATPTQQPPAAPRRLELSTAQIIGSSLAAVTAAFVASVAGTAGTIIGAGLGSMIATAGAATYTWWLRRTSEVVRRTATHVRETGMGSTVVVPGLRTRRAPGENEDAGAADDEEDDTAQDRWAFLRGRPWGKVLLAGVAVMVVAFASITVIEAVTGRPISSITRGDSGNGTSVSHILGRDKAPAKHQEKKPRKTPGPTPTTGAPSSSSPTPSPTEGTSASPSPSPTPSESGSPSPSPESPAPSEAP